jgi:hypothetical protein
VYPAEPTNGLPERLIRTLAGNWLWFHHLATVAELIEALLGIQRRCNDGGLIERHGSRSPARARRDLANPIPAVA